jgi:hypothetical protein
VPPTISIFTPVILAAVSNPHNSAHGRPVVVRDRLAWSDGEALRPQRTLFSERGERLGGPDVLLIALLIALELLLLDGREARA